MWKSRWCSKKRDWHEEVLLFVKDQHKKDCETIRPIRVDAGVSRKKI